MSIKQIKRLDGFKERIMAMGFASFEISVTYEIEDFMADPKWKGSIEVYQSGDWGWGEVTKEYSRNTLKGVVDLIEAYVVWLEEHPPEAEKE